METMADKLDDTYDSMKWVEVERKVVDLLTEQVECADIVVLNKIDRVEDAAQRKALNGMVAALNPSASIFEASFGKIPMHEVFGRSESQYMKRVDSDDEIRAAVFAARAAACTVPQCDDPTHAHSHGGSSHGASHSHGSDCAVPDCTDPSHSHGHGHGHSHGHSHAETAAEKYGITTFVYSRRRPFHPKRLLDLIAMRNHPHPISSRSNRSSAHPRTHTCSWPLSERSIFSPQARFLPCLVAFAPCPHMNAWGIPLLNHSQSQAFTVTRMFLCACLFVCSFV